MSHVLYLTRDDPVIYLKAYGGVQIEGVEATEITCKIDSPQLATLVEEDGNVYVTVSASCYLEVPVNSSIIIERAMGSALIKRVKNPISINKVLGNLTLIEVGQADVDKIGGNFSAQHVTGHLHIGKIAGNLTVDDAHSLACEKVGGNCVLRQIHTDALIDKAGGSCLVQNIAGDAHLAKFGGSFKARGVNLGDGVKAGGSLELIDCQFVRDLRVAAGGNIAVALNKDQTDLSLNMTSGNEKIKIEAFGEELSIRDYEYQQIFGDGSLSVELSAGGSVSIAEAPEEGEDFIGDLSDRFSFKESAFSEMIQRRIESATRRADAKVKAAEIRLGKIQDRLEKFRGFPIDMGVENEDAEKPTSVPKRPAPPVTRPAGKKGATDEERLMILKMLQEGTITVDEAEALFRAMEK